MAAASTSGPDGFEVVAEWSPSSPGLDDFEVVAKAVLGHVPSGAKWEVMVIRLLEMRRRCRKARAMGTKGQMMIDAADRSVADIPGNLRRLFRQRHQES